jgi:hypothetical protein
MKWKEQDWLGEEKWLWPKFPSQDLYSLFVNKLVEPGVGKLQSTGKSSLLLMLCDDFLKYF